MNSDSNPAAKLWGGRFSSATAASVERFTASVGYDRRLAPYDIQGSLAHAAMLARVGLLTTQELNELTHGLYAIAAEISEGRFIWDEALEDVHMNIESRLTERVGAVGKKLHTARSRNDQVATDLRLYVRAELDALRTELRHVQLALLDLAEREADTLMLGFTHLQPAQPITVGHHLLAWFEMLQRDLERLADCRKRVNTCPLGAAALAGTPHPIDRWYTAAALGFDQPAENSLDAVSDRDFVIEFTSALALIMMHLSRVAEELILWNCPLFGFVELPDAFCTGSSIMPQKKNPDVPELIRGKSGRVFGHLMALLTLMKGQPLAYNRDNQEDKEALFDAVDTTRACVQLCAELVPALRFRPERLEAALQLGYVTATELADFLVTQGIPFRQAHEITGQIVRHAIAAGQSLEALSLDTLRQYAPHLSAEVFAHLTPRAAVIARDHYGATAPNQVRAAIARARSRLAEHP